jgi:hypothetical protein
VPSRLEHGLAHVVVQVRREHDIAQWVNVYFVGYVIFVLGVVAALWKAGVIERIGTEWTVIGIAIGLGIMVSVANSGRKETIEVDHR